MAQSHHGAANGSSCHRASVDAHRSIKKCTHHANISTASSTENHREIGLSHFIDYSSSSPESSPCSLWLFLVFSVLNSDFRCSGALQFSDQNPPKNQRRANQRPRAEAFVENDVRSDGRENGFAGENQRGVGRARMALRP